MKIVWVQSISFVLCLYSWVAAVPLYGQTESTDAYAEAASAFQHGQLEEAEQKLRPAITAEPDRPDLLGLLGLVLDAKKEYEQAKAFHQRALKLAPHSAGLWNNFGNHCLARGKEAEARHAFLQALTIEPQHVNANLQLARIALADKHPDEALRYLDHLNPSDQHDGAVLLLRARCLHSAGQPDAAMAIVDRLEQDSTADVRLAFSVGVIFTEWEKYDRAEAAFSGALQRDPASPEILHNVGLAALRAGHLDRAQSVLALALQQNPEDVESIFSLARAHAAKGQSETALVLLARARQLDPSRLDLLLYMARMYEDAGFFTGAADAYDEYLKLQPGDQTARRERGFMYCRLGKMKTGLPDLNWYVKQYPRDAVGHFELGLCETLGDTRPAFREFNEALRLKPDLTTARQARGWLLGREGKWNEALSDLKSVVDRQPENSMALLQLGRTYLELDRPAEALECLRRAQNLAPENRGVLMQLNRALRKLGRNQEAANVLDKFKNAAPDREALKASAQIFDYLGLDPAEQRERFRRNLTDAIAANPSNPELQVQMGALHLADGKTEEALTAFRDVLKLSPGISVLKEAAAALLEHQQYGLAREFLTRVVSADPSVDNRLELAAATFHAAGPEAGLAEIEKIPVANRNGDVYLLRAQILDAMGRFADSTESLNAGFRMEPKRADLYFWASLFLLKHKRDQQALEFLDQATKVVPDDADLLLTKAVVLELVRKTEEADDLLKKIQFRWPESGRCYLVQGIIEATHRKPEAALESLRTAIALGEKTASTYYFLADVMRMARPGDKEGARQAISESLRLDPGDASSHVLAGKIALEQEDPARAAEELREAVRLSPKLAEAHYTLMMAYRKLGRQNEAMVESDIFRRIREQNPDSEDDAAGIRKMLFAGDGPSQAAPRP